MGVPEYIIHLKSSEAVKPEDLQILQSILNAVIGNIDKVKYPNAPTVARVDANVQKFRGGCIEESILFYQANLAFLY